jgi:HSP20 family protein
MLRVDVYELDRELVVDADLPGVEAEAIALRVLENSLSIDVRRGERMIVGARVHRRERLPAEFRERIELPARVDPCDVQATLRRGVLRIRISRPPLASRYQLVSTPRVVDGNKCPNSRFVPTP